MATYILIIIAAYLGLILIISLFTGKGESGNDAFFLADRKSPWYIVAIGMLGDSISGVTFVAVPGMVGSLDMTYMQLVAGFFFGYLIVAKILLPLYYRLNLTSIYTYLQSRFGTKAYQNGGVFLYTFPHGRVGVEAFPNSHHLASPRFRRFRDKFLCKCCRRSLHHLCLHFSQWYAHDYLD
jgi:Na+/proline symporter